MSTWICISWNYMWSSYLRWIWKRETLGINIAVNIFRRPRNSALSLRTRAGFLRRVFESVMPLSVDSGCVSHIHHVSHRHPNHNDPTTGNLDCTHTHTVQEATWVMTLTPGEFSELLLWNVLFLWNETRLSAPSSDVYRRPAFVRAVVQNCELFLNIGITRSYF